MVLKTLIIHFRVANAIDLTIPGGNAQEGG